MKMDTNGNKMDCNWTTIICQNSCYIYIAKSTKNVNQRSVAFWILPLKKGYPEQVALKKASKQTKFSVFIAVILVELLKEYLYSFTYKF